MAGHGGREVGALTVAKLWGEVAGEHDLFMQGYLRGGMVRPWRGKTPGREPGDEPYAR